MKHLIFFLGASFLPACAGELDPRIAPMEATYLKQLEEIKTKANAEAEKGVQVYLAELKTAEDKATKSGDAKVLTAITKEKSDVESGLALPIPNADLPKLAQVQHRTYYKAYEAALDSIAKQKSQLDSKYLAALGKLSSGLDPALLEQIDEQKKRVVSGNFGPITNLQTQIAGTRWQSVKEPAKVELFEPGGKFVYWKYTTPDPETVVIHWSENSSVTLKLAKDGKTLMEGTQANLVYIQQSKK
jgi:hypothetical protein